MAELTHPFDQELNVGKRTFTLRELYVFALNDTRVALMMEEALHDAFEKQLPNRRLSP